MSIRDDFEAAAQQYVRDQDNVRRDKNDPDQSTAAAFAEALLAHLNDQENNQ